jgi:hypothetical protein
MWQLFEILPVHLLPFLEGLRVVRGFPQEFYQPPLLPGSVDKPSVAIGGRSFGIGKCAPFYSALLPLPLDLVSLQHIPTCFS